MVVTTTRLYRLLLGHWESLLAGLYKNSVGIDLVILGVQKLAYDCGSLFGDVNQCTKGITRKYIKYQRARSRRKYGAVPRNPFRSQGQIGWEDRCHFKAGILSLSQNALLLLVYGRRLPNQTNLPLVRGGVPFPAKLRWPIG